MRSLINFLLKISYRNRKKQYTTASVGYSLSGEDDKILKINTALDRQSIKLQLDNDYIILDAHKSQLLLDMIKKSVEQMNSYKVHNKILK